MPEPTQEDKDWIDKILAGKIPVEVLQTTEELRLLAERFNWDDDPDVLFPVIRNSKCDKGTALFLFWLSDPVSFFELWGSEEEALATGEWSRDWYHLLVEIQSRYVAGFYKESDFHVDPKKEAVGDFTSDSLKTDIPDVMRQPC